MKVTVMFAILAIVGCAMVQESEQIIWPNYWPLDIKPESNSLGDEIPRFRPPGFGPPRGDRGRGPPRDHHGHGPHGRIDITWIIEFLPPGCQLVCQPSTTPTEQPTQPYTSTINDGTTAAYITTQANDGTTAMQANK